MPRLGTDDAIKSLLTLPPLKEQERIVEKVEKLQELSKKFKEIYNSNEKTRANLKKAILEEVEKSDTNNELLISLEKLFGNFEKVIKTKEDVKDIRNLVLSLAVRGKLVPQIESEEPASELLQKIKEEKERLISEKVIKKEKPLPPITEAEKPFNIPNSWEWVRLGNIGSWGSGATPSRTNSEYYLNGTIPWLKTGELNDGYINSSEEKITEKALKNTSVRLCSPGDVLIAMYGGTIGKLGILNIEATTNQACCACTTYKGINNKYLFLYLLSKRENFKSQGVGGAQPNISKEKIINTLFLLPPLQEQERIVKRVDELMAVCDGLESKIEMGEKINQKLLSSLLKK
ncbi:MAG: restriction endonuclease subunit S [Fusobacteriaceae bacterium]